MQYHVSLFLEFHTKALHSHANVQLFKRFFICTVHNSIKYISDYCNFSCYVIRISSLKKFILSNTYDLLSSMEDKIRHFEEFTGYSMKIRLNEFLKPLKKGCKSTIKVLSK